MNTAHLVTIAEAAKILGVSDETLRRWEQKGLIAPERTPGGARRYDLDHLQALKRAARGKIRVNKLPQALDKIEKKLESLIPHARPSTPTLPPSHIEQYIKPFSLDYVKNTQLVATLDDDLNRPKAGVFNHDSLPSLNTSGILRNVKLATVAKASLVSTLALGIILVGLITDSYLTAPQATAHFFASDSPTAKTLHPISDLAKQIVSLLAPASSRAMQTKTQLSQTVQSSSDVLGITSKRSGALTINTNLALNGDFTLNGKIVSPNFINSLTAGSNVVVDNTNPSNPTISVSLPTNLVNTIGKKSGDISLGTGLSISDSGKLSVNSTLSDIRGNGGCSSCITDSDVADNITISSSGSVDPGALSGAVTVGKGGTGLSSVTTGDLLYASAANTLKNLAIGSTGQVLNVSGGLPVWASSLNLPGTLQLQSSSTLYSGTGVPANTIGSNGDYYFRTDGTTGNTSVYFKTGGAWISAGGGSLQNAYTVGNTITTTSGSDIGFTLASGLTTPTSFTLTNNGTNDAFSITNNETVTNGIIVKQNTAAKTLANAINITQSAGNITNGLNFTGTFTNLINSPTLIVSNAGAITGATGISSSGTITFSGLTANRPVITTTGGQLTTEAQLATSRGGLGADVTAAGAGELLYSSSTTAYGHLAAGTANYVLLSNGAAAPSWTAQSSLTGVVPSFNNITSGTNTQAAMVVAAGASLTYSGGTATSGIINANQLLGSTWAAPGSIGSTTANSGAFTTLTSSGASTLGTGSSLTNTFGSGASSANTIGSTTTPGALTLHGATTLDNTFTVSGSNLTSLGGNLTVTGTAWTATPTISGLITATSGLTSNGTLTVGANQNLTLNSGNGVYSQTFSGTTQTPFSLTSTFSPTAGGTQNNINTSVTNTAATSANTLRGLNLSLTDSSTALANTDIGINVDVSAGTNASATRYAAIFSGGNVGVGTTSPGELLTVNGSSAAGLYYPIRVAGGDGLTANTNAAGILFSEDGIVGDGNRGKGALVYVTDGTGFNRGSFQFLQNSTGNTSNPTLSNAVLTINNSGSVGIATTSPSYPLVVEKDGISTTPTTSTQLQNATAATAGAPNQYSPSLQFTGQSWNTGSAASNQFDAREYLSVSSANPPTAKLNWGFQRASGGYTDYMNLDNSGNLTISGNLIANGGSAGFWSRSGTTITPATAGDLLSLPENSTDTTGNLFNISYASPATLTGALVGVNVDLNNGQVTNSNNNVTGVNVKLPTVTDSNTTGTVNIKGLSFGFGAGSGINQTGAGATVYTGLDVSLPALTQTSGTLTGNGVNITTSSQITTGGTANGVNISASGVGAGSLNGVNISAITGGAGTETALNIGSGWDNVLSVNGTSILNGSGVAQVAAGGTNITSYTAGDLIYASGTTTLAKLAGGTPNNGKVLTVSSGLPVWGTIAGSSCTDCVVNDPTSVTTQTITPSTNIASLVVRQTTAVTPTADIFDVTNKDGTTKYFYVDSSGNVSTGAISNTTLTLTPTSDTTALTLVGTNVATSKLAYFNSKNASGTIFDISYGAAQTITANNSITGQTINLSTNVTANSATTNPISVTGASITLPAVTNTNTSGTNALKGLVVSAGGGLNQNGTGGTTTFSGVDVTIPALTQSLGTLTGNGVNITTPSSLTTGGTANGVNITATGVSVGSLNGINISGITAGAGTETAINIGSGWDTAISAANLITTSGNITTTGTGAITAANGLTVTAGGETITAGNLGVGNAALSSMGITVRSALTASGGSAVAIHANSAMTTAANNDSLYGLFLSPSIVNTGGFTGTSLYGAYINSVSGAANNYELYTNNGAVSFGDAVTVRANGLNVTGNTLTSGVFEGNSTSVNTTLQATGSTSGSGNNGSIYFKDSGGTVRGRVETVNTQTVGGTGADGACSVSSGSTNITTGSCAGRGTADSVATKITATVAAGANAISIGSCTGINGNDEVLLIQMIGTGAGNYESKTVSSCNSTTLNLKQSTTNAYTISGSTSLAQVVRVAQYTTVSVTGANSTLTVSTWDGTTNLYGGVMAFRASTSVTVGAGAFIDLNGLGLAGASAPTNGGSAGAGGNTSGSNGVGGGGGSAGGSGTGSGAGGGGSAAGGGGGGGSSSGYGGGGAGGMSGGGGGGSYGGAGTSVNGTSGAGGNGGRNSGGGGTGGAGAAGTGGAAGSTYGAAALTTIFPGSGGGSGGGGSGAGGGAGVNGGAAGTNGGAGGNGGGGGAGGGVLYIGSPTFTNSGTVRANGATGISGSAGGSASSCGASTNCNAGGGGAGGAGGGGGSGGSIFIQSNNTTLGTTTATGGSGGTAGNGGNGGNAGSGIDGTAGGGGGAGANGGNAGANGGPTGPVPQAGASVGATGGAGGDGRIRVEGTTISGTSSPAASTSSTQATINNGANGYGTLYIGSTNTASADLAEYYVSGDKTMEAGDVVVVSNKRVLDDNSEEVVTQGVLRKSQSSYEPKLIGVISTSPGITLGSIDGDSGQSDKRILALKGRVPIKVNGEGGPIHIGDYLTSSSTPGVAMKANHIGQAVAIALQDYSSTDVGKIEGFINVGLADPGQALNQLLVDTDGSLIVPNLKVKTLTLPGLTGVGSEASGSGGLTYTVLDVGQKLSTHEQELADLQTQTATNSAQLANLSSQVAGVATQSAQIAQQISSTSATIAQTNSLVASQSATLASQTQILKQVQDDINGLKLTPPQTLFATSSAILADLKVTSDATISGQLTALSDVKLGNTLIAGNLAVDGLFSISNNSINVLGTPINGNETPTNGILYLQNSPLSNLIDLFSGAVTISKNGLLSIQRLAVSNKTLDTVVIKTGTISVDITTAELTNNSKIFVSANQPLPVAVTNKDIAGGKFTISLQTTAANDVSVDWWIVDQH